MKSSRVLLRSIKKDRQLRHFHFPNRKPVLLNCQYKRYD
uniref:Uncharacterized protein n=1 Tax=Brassica oleracea TaxID=3712 RepID=A0A3P6B0F5_BRAOL|nr:unnamed protein product [Brassica oleracea]